MLSIELAFFRILLHFYPAEFRHEYGNEMEQLFRDRMLVEPRFRLWPEILADIALTAPKEHWNILCSDARYGVRTLASSPSFSLITFFVIALGIGSTSAIFSLVNAVLLRSLPYGHPGQLVYLWSPNVNFHGVPRALGPNIPDIYDWQRLSRSFSAIALLNQSSVNMAGHVSSERLAAAFVSGSFFETMQSSPELGRGLGPNDESPGGQHAAVISDALWRRLFSANNAALGKQIRLNRENYTVVGVMPPGFGYPHDGDIPYEHTGFANTDVWLPLTFTAAKKTDRQNFASTIAIGRLREGTSVSAAESELRTIESRLDPLYPEMWRGWTVYITPLIETVIGPVEKMLWLLLGAVSVVFLIAMANVANLMLARTAGRSHEMGIRTALGAERARIIRQLLTESLLLSCAGGLGGIAVAFAAVKLLVRLNPGNIPRFESAGVDLRVLFVAFTLALLNGLLCGLAPGISAARAGINALLKQAGSRGIRGGTNRWRNILISLEVALSVILLAGAGLLIRSYLQLESVDPGFSPTTVTFWVHLDGEYKTLDQRNNFDQSFLAKLQNLPGVKWVGASNALPLANTESVSFIEVKNAGQSNEMVETRSITPGYRQALGTPLLRGRDFDDHDVQSNAPVALVNESFAKTYFHGGDPLGQQVRMGIRDFRAASWRKVVGVVANIRHVSLEQAGQPQLFTPSAVGGNFALQSALPATQIIAEVRATLRSLDPSLTLESIQTMRQRMEETNAFRRFQTTLLTGFAVLAVSLALVGFYGLMSYAVKQRTAEIGVRLAVGSSRSQILKLVLAQGLRLTLTGLAIGLAAAVVLTNLVRSWLFEVSATDPLTFVAVPVFMLIVAICACLLPALKATRIDPIQTLRQE